MLRSLQRGLVRGDGAGCGPGPPAHAIVIHNVVFTGVLTVGNGMSYPCVTGKNPSSPNPPQFDPAKCPPNTPNTTWWSFTGAALSTTAKVAKTKCLLTDIACLQVSTTTISGSGTVKENCSQWTAPGGGRPRRSTSSTPRSRSRRSRPCRSAGSVWTGINVLSGTAMRNGQPTASSPAPSRGAPDPTVGSCWDKRQKTWVLAGSYTVIWPNN